MQMFLFKMANALVKLPMLGGGNAANDVNANKEAAGKIEAGYVGKPWYENIVKPIADALSVILGPMLILLGSAGAIYAIVLGVNLSRAESSDKREEAKKRLINFVIGIAAAIILLVLLKLVVENITSILAWVTPETSSAGTGSGQ